MYAHKAMTSQSTHVQPPTIGASYDLRSGSYIDVAQDIPARITPHEQPEYLHQHPTVIEGTPYERDDFTSIRAAVSVRRHGPGDEEPNSKSKMWDPVKDCDDPYTVRPGPWKPSTHQTYTEQQQYSYNDSKDSRVLAVTDRNLGHDDHSYGQSEHNGQRYTYSGITGVAWTGGLHYSQSQAILSRSPYTQQQTLTSGFQASASMRPFGVSYTYDEFQLSRQYQFG